MHAAKWLMAVGLGRPAAGVGSVGANNRWGVVRARLDSSRIEGWAATIRRAVVSLAAVAAAVQMNARDADAQSGQTGQAPALSGRYAAYDAALRQTLLTPSDAKALAAFATIAVEIGDLEGAISALERLLLISGDLPDVKLELGVLYFRLGSFETARVYLRSAIASPNATALVKERANRYLKART